MLGGKTPFFFLKLCLILKILRLERSFESLAIFILFTKKVLTTIIAYFSNDCHWGAYFK